MRSQLVCPPLPVVLKLDGAGALQYLAQTRNVNIGGAATDGGHCNSGVRGVAERPHVLVRADCWTGGAGRKVQHGPVPTSCAAQGRRRRCALRTYPRGRRWWACSARCACPPVTQRAALQAAPAWLTPSGTAPGEDSSTRNSNNWVSAGVLGACDRASKRPTASHVCLQPTVDPPRRVTPLHSHLAAAAGHQSSPCCLPRQLQRWQPRLRDLHTWGDAEATNVPTCIDVLWCARLPRSQRRQPAVPPILHLPEPAAAFPPSRACHQHPFIRALTHSLMH